MNRFEEEAFDRWLNDCEEDDSPREVRCRDCLLETVYWAKDFCGRWMLYDFRTSKRHVCKAEVLTASRMDAFENMD